MRSLKIQHHCRNVMNLHEMLRKIDSTLPYCMSGEIRPCLKRKRSELEFMMKHERLVLGIVKLGIEEDIRRLSSEIEREQVDGYEWAYILMDIGHLEMLLNNINEHLNETSS